MIMGIFVIENKFLIAFENVKIHKSGAVFGLCAVGDFFENSEGHCTVIFLNPKEIR